MSPTPSARLEGVNLLRLTPRRLASWTEDEDCVTLRRDPPERPWRQPLAWLGYKMSTKSVRLDDVGSFAWKLLDGKRTVADVAEELRREFGERIEPVEERFGELIRMLHRGEMISYTDLEVQEPVSDRTPSEPR